MASESSSSVPAPLATLVRKAAVDAGFDLEPERDGAWWRLRASGHASVAWVRSAGDPRGALIALSLDERLAAARTGGAVAISESALPPLPSGAVGALVCPTPQSLLEALRRVRSVAWNVPEQLLATWDIDVQAALGGAAPTLAVGSVASIPTDVVAEVRRRVGQDLYRAALLEFWGYRCAVTGLAVPELLRASHAKPWADASDVERLDVFNGLLLAAHLDALFDRGFLAFDDAGVGLVSPALPAEALRALGLGDAPLRLRSVEPRHRPYLRYHREHVFRAEPG